MKLVTKSAIAATMLVASQAAFADGHGKCGDIVMAEMDWPSAELMANVDKIILEEGFGCDVEMVVGGTMTIFAAMNEKGKPHVAAELWANAVANPLKVAVDEGRMTVANTGPITELGEGWFVPDYVLANNPELKTVVDILDHPELFPHPEDPSKGAFYGCPAGWGCQLANANLYRAFDMKAKGWILVDPGSGAGLDGSVAKAVERGENWFGYYWSPTALVGKYNLSLLDWGVPFAGSENWDGCVALPEQECADPKPSAWTESVVNTVVTSKFANNKHAMQYFNNRVFPGPVMNGMLVYMADEQATGEDAAYEFLAKHEDIWGNWVSEGVVAKVKAAL